MAQRAAASTQAGGGLERRAPRKQAELARARTRSTDDQATLLSHAAGRGAFGGPPAPLAERMRPRSLDEVVDAFAAGDGSTTISGT